MSEPTAAMVPRDLAISGGSRAAARPLPSVEALLRQAAAAHAKGQPARAEMLTRMALTRSPDDPDAWNARGVFLRALGKQETAIACYWRALALAPAQAGIWSNLGNAQKDLKQIESALVSHQRAVALRPAEASYWHNLGIACREGGRYGEAVEAFDAALRLDPDNAEIRWDRAGCHLHLGRFVPGWSDYEARLETRIKLAHPLTGRRWAGQPYRGQRLLVLAEQGFGDAIWAARALAWAKARGGELVMECAPALIPLFEPLHLVDRFLGRGEAPPPADWHCHVCSLPGLLSAGETTLPAEPYLRAPESRLAKFRALIPDDGRLRVGIVWSGSTTFKLNAERAQPLARFLASFAIPGVRLYSLQKGPPEKELAQLSEAASKAGTEAPIVDLSASLGDFADTAAAIACLDLVIMTDSAVAHLAGALGKPVWILLNHVPYWIWGHEREGTAWYPSARLFRPSTWNAWDEVFDAAAAALIEYRFGAERPKIPEPIHTLQDREDLTIPEATMQLDDVDKAKAATARLVSCLVQTMNETNSSFQERFLARLDAAYCEAREDSTDRHHDMELFQWVRELLTGFSMTSGQGMPYLQDRT